MDALNNQPELQLLLLCMRVCTGTTPLEDLTAFLAGSGDSRSKTHVGWHKVVPLALNHHVFPFLYKALKQARRALPENTAMLSFVSGLRDTYMAVAAQNVRNTEALLLLQQFLADNHVVAIPIKGAVLAEMAFDSISMRQFNDIDLVIEKTKLLRAIALLKDKGYTVERPPPSTHPAAYAATYQDWILTDRSQGMCLDIKPAVVSRTIADNRCIRSLLHAACPCPIDSTRTILAPTPEAMLLIVCMHGVHETWAKLSQVADVAGMIRSAGISPKKLIALARDWHQVRALCVGLELARLLIGVSLPDEVTALIRTDAVARRLANDSAKELCSASHVFETPSRVKWRMERQSRDSLCDAIRCGLRQFLTPTSLDLEWVRLPQALFPLYPLVRLARLAAGSLHHPGAHS